MNKEILYSEYIQTGQIMENKLTKMKSCDIIEMNQDLAFNITRQVMFEIFPPIEFLVTF